MLDELLDISAGMAVKKRAVMKAGSGGLLRDDDLLVFRGLEFTLFGSL